VLKKQQQKNLVVLVLKIVVCIAGYVACTGRHSILNRETKNTIFFSGGIRTTGAGTKPGPYLGRQEGAVAPGG